MHQRAPELTRFLSSLHQSLKAAQHNDGVASLTTDKIMHALRTPQPASAKAPNWLPQCNALQDVLDTLTAKGAQSKPSPHDSSGIQQSMASHASAMKALAPLLSWWIRPDAHDIGEPFLSGHVNATVIGKGGLEERDDVWIGISFLEPNVTYPEHHHAPEEIYLVMSPGEWKNENTNWIEPGIGGIVRNPTDIMHTMRSGKQPLLATWSLWAG